MKERRFFYKMLRKIATAKLGQCLKFINNSEKIVSSFSEQMGFFKLRPKAA